MSNEIPPQVFAKAYPDPIDPRTAPQSAGVGILEIGLSLAITFISLLIYACLHVLISAQHSGQFNIRYPLYTHFLTFGFLSVSGFAIGCALGFAFRSVTPPGAVRRTPGEQLMLLLGGLCTLDVLFRFAHLIVSVIINNGPSIPLRDILARYGHYSLSISHETLTATLLLIALLVGQRSGWRLFCMANLFISSYGLFHSIMNIVMQSMNMRGEFPVVEWLDRGFYFASVAAHLAAIGLLLLSEKPNADANRPSLQRHFFGKTLWICYLLLSLVGPFWFYLANLFKWR